MTFDEKFLQAVLIRPPKVLGLQLRPYCAGHALVLDALGNPFVTPGADWTIEALGIAVLVCSLTFEQCKQMLIPRGRGDRFALSTRFALWRLGRRAWRRRKTIEHEMQTFVDYLMDYQEMPDYWDSKGGSLNAPWPFAAVIGVVMALKGAVSVADAWNMPLSEAVYYGATVGDLLGDDALMSVRDKQGLADARAGRNVVDNRPQTEEAADV